MQGILKRGEKQRGRVWETLHGGLADWNGVGKVWKVISLPQKRPGASMSKAGRAQAFGEEWGPLEVQAAWREAVWGRQDWAQG